MYKIWIDPNNLSRVRFKRGPLMCHAALFSNFKTYNMNKSKPITAAQAANSLTEIDQSVMNAIREYLQVLTATPKMLDVENENIFVSWPVGLAIKEVEFLQVREDGKIFITAEGETVELNIEDFSTHDLIGILEGIEKAITVKE